MPDSNWRTKSSRFRLNLIDETARCHANMRATWFDDFSPWEAMSDEERHLMIGVMADIFRTLDEATAYLTRENGAFGKRTSSVPYLDPAAQPAELTTASDWPGREDWPPFEAALIDQVAKRQTNSRANRCADTAPWSSLPIEDQHSTAVAVALVFVAMNEAMHNLSDADDPFWTDVPSSSTREN